MNDCNLTACRYNKDNKCINDEKRTKCVEVSKRVLCLDDFYARMKFETAMQRKDGLTFICDTNPNCEHSPENCGFSVEYSTFGDVGKGIRTYMCGRDRCKYCK